MCGDHCASPEAGCVGTGTGLRGDYYAGASFITFFESRIDADIDFQWGFAEPLAGLDPAHFSVRWSGVVEPRFSEEYTFYSASDDGHRLWIDDQLVIDDFSLHAEREQASKPIQLVAGKKYRIRMEFMNYLGTATARLRWSSTSEGKAMIPRSQLYPEPLTPVPPFTTHEAEAATSKGTFKVSECPACSGEKRVDLAPPLTTTAKANSIELKVNATATRKHKLVIWYANEETATADAAIVVNGGTPKEHSFPPNPFWTPIFEGFALDVDLVAGANTIKISGPTAQGSVLHIDRVTIE